MAVKRLCQFDGCGRLHNSHGYCIRHGDMFRKGEPLRPLAPYKPKPPKGLLCEVPFCNEKARSLGLCGRHYQQHVNRMEIGPTTVDGESALVEWVERELAKPRGLECLLWPGGKTTLGYARWGQGAAANRMLKMVHGGLPHNQQFHRMCEELLCVNLDHYVATSNGETRFCSFCKTVKPIEDFTIRKDSQTPFSYCDVCRPRFAKGASLRRIGWTLERFDAFNYAQGGLCATCFDSNYGIALNADHNHDTMEPGALLCGNCNQAAGYLRDNAEAARSLAAYLEKWRQ